MALRDRSRFSFSMWLHLAAALALLLTTLSAAVPAAAQSGTSDIAIVSTANGHSVYDACYILVGYSQEGCDANGDGEITFQDIPYGTYTLRQTQGSAYTPDISIYVSGAADWDGWERFYVSLSGGGGSSSSGTSDVAIVPSVNGAPYFDACFVLVDYSQEGCDENRDGKITFEDIPYGTYTLRQTRGAATMADQSIYVDGSADADGWERFYVGLTAQPTSDIAVVTTQNEAQFYHACFVLVDYSQEGCDENRDGKITFEDIPHGTYVLRQTRDLGGGRYVVDTEIRVTGAADADGWERFYVKVAEPEVPPVDIALITRSPQDGELLTDACYELVGYSNVGCDEDEDGQVTFEAIPPGVYTVRQTTTPEGFPTINEFDIHIENIDDIPLSFLVRQAPEQNAPATRNVSVVFVDSTTGDRVDSGFCVELEGASEIGCDEDLQDGQIDFLDVPSGDWTVDWSEVPADWSIDRENLVVKVDASSGSRTHQMTFVSVTPKQGSGSTENASTGSAGDTRTMSISAMTCENDSGAIADCEWAIGSEFTVTTADGEEIGSCTLEGKAEIDNPVVGDRQCQVDIPADQEVTITLDAASVPDGYAVVENPMQFRWPEMVPSFVGVIFSIQPE